MKTTNHNTSVSIRRASAKDAAIIADFRYKMFSEMRPKENFSKKRKRFMRESIGYYKSHAGLRSQFDCIAVVNGKIVGCGSILFLDGPPHIVRIGSRLGYILNVFVEKEHRRRGIAGKIMKKLHAEGRKHLIRRVSLHASAAGYPLYRGLGYRENDMYLEMDL